MLRRYSSFTPTIATASRYLPLPLTPALTSCVSQKVAAAAATHWENVCHFRGPYSPRELLEDDLKGNLRLLEDLRSDPSYYHWHSSDTRLSMFLDSTISQLLAIAKNPLVTQADLGEMRKAGVLGVLHEHYLTPKEPASHLTAKAEELAKILSNPPKASDPYHYLNQLADSVEEGEEPSSALNIAKSVFLSSKNPATRQTAARLHAIALREIISHYEFLRNEVERGNKEVIPLAIKTSDNAPNSNDFEFQDVLAELRAALKERGT